jgi:hypothetical protein
MKKVKEAVADDANGTQAPEPTRAFLTTAELQAQVLPLSRRGIFALRKNGTIPSITSGGKVLFHKESVVSALLRRQQGSVA